ncbi:hypothetical protein [Rhizobium laguerreae]|uniref:hypothetical protein n=1 Tax=Rhizobium laguerreae TaxID=1076926 RepID=UPI001C91EEB8|nr:hypothetical protein [Rhizobium laguerreae]MBY3389195.1 hypothetical protein [Rhizobium laguerreae]MBY3402946.1 hypothetical protein [Rhizobium laguerreae]MBY3409885.1 hypothetical protein [Rhizobium laguerreae]
MLEEVNVPDRGGALHLSKVLPEADMDLLLSLPFPKPNREEVIDANFDIARHFLPRAYDLGGEAQSSLAGQFRRGYAAGSADQLRPVTRLVCAIAKLCDGLMVAKTLQNACRKAPSTGNKAHESIRTGLFRRDCWPSRKEPEKDALQ